MGSILAQYKGRYFGVTDPIQKLNLDYSAAVMEPYYPHGIVDDVVYQVDAIRLCDATAGELYSSYTPLDVQYERGSRPVLEQVVAERTDEAMSEREKLLALLGFVRDLPDQPREIPDDFGGGTEEQVIQKSDNYCGEQARLMAHLCQIAALPARRVVHYLNFLPDGSLCDGHALTEVYVEGGWAYADIRGIVIEWPDGHLASTYDLMMFPEIIANQPDHIVGQIREGYDLAGTRSRFVSPRNINALSNYFISQADRYDYTTVPHPPGWREAYREMRDRTFAEYEERFRGLVERG